MKKSRRCSLLFVLFVLSYAGIVNGDDSCVDCHGSETRMKELGSPQFFMTVEEIRAQTGMPALCTDCHLGDSKAQAKEAAHTGLLLLRAVGKKWDTPARREIGEQDRNDWPFLEPRGSNSASQLGPKRLFDGVFKDNPDYRTIIYHDKNPGTLAFNPLIAEKTCGKCHPEAVKGFLKTAMGGASGVHTQSQYKYWTAPSGPQSCGLWLGALTPPGQDAFSDDRVQLFNQHSTRAITAGVAFNLQRNCNQCHVGCLDCHYSPLRKIASDPKLGGHTFVRKPDALACYGGGRSFSCHAGPLERRRGDGYLRGEFTQATDEGKKILRERPDVHAQKGVLCIDCHEQNKVTGFHADFRRDVDCAKCHPRSAADHAKGVHRNVDCASCHTALIGGYAFNFWTVGGEPGKENPATRIQDYTVDAIAPVLVKNPKGVWIPVHVVPHTSGNVKAAEVKLSKTLVFRDRPAAAVDRRYYSNDSYAITGLIKNLDDADHDTMVWLNLDRVAHGTGKSRACKDCHASTAQRVTTHFSPGSYKDVEDGSYTIIADEKGLRVAEFAGPDGGPAPKGLEPLLKAWNLKGNFSLPKISREKLYQNLEQEYEAGRFKH